MARLLAVRGHRLVLASRNAAKLEDLAATLRRDHGCEVLTYAIDLSAAGAAQRMFEYTRGERLCIDVLVNNAGVGMIDEHVALDAARLHHMLQLNVVAVAELCHRYGGEMMRRRSGAILNIASTAAYQPTPYCAAYGASKAFVLNFSEALAKELEDFGVRVSCLCPGPTDTAFFDAVDPGRIAGRHHFGKAGRAAAGTVARAGLALLFDGGLSRVVGWGNRALVFTNRCAPRSVVAALSKKLLRPRGARSGAT